MTICNALPGLKRPARDAPADCPDLDGHEAIAVDMLEPEIAGQQIDRAVPVHVSRGHAFGVLEPARTGRRSHPPNL